MILVSVCSSTGREWQRSVRTVLKYIQHTFCGRSHFSSMFCWETFKFLFVRIQQRLLGTQNTSYLPAIISVRHPACQSGNVTCRSRGRHSLRSDLYPPCLETVCHWILCLWQCVCMCRGRGGQQLTIGHEQRRDKGIECYIRISSDRCEDRGRVW